MRLAAHKPNKIYFQVLFVETVLLIFAKTVSVMLDAVYLAMLVRMILPFFVNPEENKIYALSILITEPVIIPVRFLMVKLNIGQSSPVDWSFFVTAILLSVLKSMLPVI